jgi:hypothetical protein
VNKNFSLISAKKPSAKACGRQLFMAPALDVINGSCERRATTKGGKNEGVMIAAKAKSRNFYRSLRPLIFIFLLFSDYLQMASRTSNHHFPSGARTSAPTCNPTRPSS